MFDSDFRNFFNAFKYGILRLDVFMNSKKMNFYGRRRMYKPLLLVFDALELVQHNFIFSSLAFSTIC